MAYSKIRLYDNIEQSGLFKDFVELFHGRVCEIWPNTPVATLSY